MLAGAVYITHCVPSGAEMSETLPGAPAVWVRVSTSPVSPRDTVPSRAIWPSSTTLGVATTTFGPASSVTVWLPLEAEIFWVVSVTT